MATVGAYEAKTHLTQLLERVAKGERITITKHGVPVATLQPADSAKKKPVREIIDQLKRLRSGQRLDGPSIRKIIEDRRNPSACYEVKERQHPYRGRRSRSV